MGSLGVFYEGKEIFEILIFHLLNGNFSKNQKGLIQNEWNFWDL